MTLDLSASKSTRPSSGRRAMRRDPLHNREKILTVAAELMSQRGSNVPLAEIAEAAGVGVGTFYRGYPDRTAVRRACRGGTSRNGQSNPPPTTPNPHLKGTFRSDQTAHRQAGGRRTSHLLQYAVIPPDIMWLIGI